MAISAEKDVAFNRLCTLWMQTINRMYEIESIPMDFGTGLLHPSEIHTIEAIGLYPGMNVTALALRMGVSRGAASQMVSRLAGKGLIEKYRLPDNEKEVCLRLTQDGGVAFRGHETQHGWIRQRIFDRLGNMDTEAYRLLLSVFEVIDELTIEMLDEHRHIQRLSEEE
jgi:DNA-binding MarR family transcriptional regulator